MACNRRYISNSRHTSINTRLCNNIHNSSLLSHLNSRKCTDRSARILSPVMAETTTSGHKTIDSFIFVMRITVTNQLLYKTLLLLTFVWLIRVRRL